MSTLEPHVVWRGLQTPNGHFRMVALDQRPPMFDAIAQARKITREQVAYADVTAAKRLLVKALARVAVRCCSIRILPCRPRST